MVDVCKYHNHNATILEDLCAGDLIEFPRGRYSHWAVYIGNNLVVHLAGIDNDGLDGEIKPECVFTICGIRFNKAKVCIDDFWNVVYDSKARKNNSNDQKWSALSPSQIVKNAMQKLGEIGYNVIYSNCEHFAKWCRYGISKSDQVDDVFTGLAIGATVVTAIGAIYALAKYFDNDETEEEKEEVKTKKKNNNKNNK